MKSQKILLSPSQYGLMYMMLWLMCWIGWNGSQASNPVVQTDFPSSSTTTSDANPALASHNPAFASHNPASSNQFPASDRLYMTSSNSNPASSSLSRALSSSSSVSSSSNKAVKEYDLPLFPPKLQHHIEQHVAHHRNKTTGKFIPQFGWVAVRNSSDARASHWLGAEGFLQRNHRWQIHFCGNEEKDKFMEDTFPNTSLLWAYNILNPQIGTAKAELWRLAILYVHGGMYMDDDANIGVPLDEVVQPNDKFIVGKEGYNWTDMCFRDEYLLSNASMNARYGLEKNSQIYFDNKFFFNWALFSMPGNPLLVRILRHVVDLIKYEYLGKSMVKLAPSDHRGKLLMCVSTFPITLAAREMVMEGKQEDIGIRVGGEQFHEYKADMKAWNNDYNPHRWVKQMQKYRMPYLREYAPPDIADYEKRLIQPQKSREIYYVQHGEKHAFPSFQTFLKMNFTLEQVQMVSVKIAEMIPTGAPLPELKER